jgi:hypothetical protein
MTLRELRGMGWWDKDDDVHYIATHELSLPQATTKDDTQANLILRDWFKGPLILAAPAPVALTDIDASIQGILRRDVLEFYLTHDGETFDELPSSYGAHGPLAVELAGGRTLLVDGNHRWAAARLRGEETFVAQVLRR